VGDSGLVDLGPADVAALVDADAAVTEVEEASEPDPASWVLVLGDSETEVGHVRFADVEPGDRFAFLGRVYEVFGDEHVESVMETGEVLARVSRPHVRKAPGAYDLDILHADGTVETITGTEEHPFWVPAVQEWVALADLEAGLVLQTYGGAEATVVGLSFLPGDVEVFNFEVEGVANYFVRGPEGDGPGVLVHNGCGGNGGGNFPNFGKQQPQTGASIGRGSPPRDGGGRYTPDPNAEGLEHTTLGTRTGSDGQNYTQGATFDADGNFTSRTDVTDHGSPHRPGHQNPHVHPSNGPNPQVGPGEPIEP